MCGDILRVCARVKIRNWEKVLAKYSQGGQCYSFTIFGCREATFWENCFEGEDGKLGENRD